MLMDNMRFLVGGLLLVHGLGHGGAIGALLWLRFSPESPTGGWLAARSWLLPALQAPEATAIAMTFWVLAMLGFVAAALIFWGIVLPGEAWRPLAVGSALVSLAGMVVFYGTWPIFNTVASLAVNAAVLFTQLVARWPAREMFGN